MKKLIENGIINHSEIEKRCQTIATASHKSTNGHLYKMSKQVKMRQGQLSKILKKQLADNNMLEMRRDLETGIEDLIWLNVEAI